ncbi:polyprenyl diphosphate synthase [Chloroflexota bacterium]
MASSKTKKISLLPKHIAIVPDGNGRWAELRGLPRLSGHQVGAENMHRLVDYLNEYPIKYVTLYGFSTENWSRPREEVDGLFQILAEFIENTTPDIHSKGVKLRHIGRIGELPAGLQKAINGAVELTRNNAGMTLNVAFNYGSRAEILDAVRSIMADGIKPEDIDEELFNKHLYTAGLPDVDLLIRTGDELRLSNFLIWQTTYSEYHFTKVLWPDFGKKDIDRALLSYSRRKRRFGGL